MANIRYQCDHHLRVVADGDFVRYDGDGRGGDCDSVSIAMILGEGMSSRTGVVCDEFVRQFVRFWDMSSTPASFPARKATPRLWMAPNVGLGLSTKTSLSFDPFCGRDGALKGCAAELGCSRKPGQTLLPSRWNGVPLDVCREEDAGEKKQKQG